MNKFNKGKLLGIVAAGLSTVSLMGVGFAAWVIKETSDNIDAGNISVTIGNVQDKRVVFDGDPLLTDSTLVFDADASKTKGNLVEASAGSTEDMSFVVKYKVKAYTEAITSGWEVKAKLVDNAYDDLATAVSEQCIAYPTASKALDLTDKVIFDKGMASGTTEGITVTPTNGTGFSTYEVTQKFTFTWGAAFNKVNPVQVNEGQMIYTGKEGVADGKEAATTNLLVANLNRLRALSFTGLKLQLSTALKTSV